MSVELVREVVLSAGEAPDASRRADAVASVDPADLVAILHAGHGGEVEVVARGIGVSPGAAVGRAVFSADAALDAYDAGDEVILVRPHTAPVDEPGMRVAAGILTAAGGPGSHAAIVALGLGLPAVCGAAGLVVGEASCTLGDRRVDAGEVISIDGTTGEVFLGDVGVQAPERSTELPVLLGWADEVRRSRTDPGPAGVRANVDTGDDARRARAAGAEGVGLCRTEHVFLGERVGLVQRYLLAADDEAEQVALGALAGEQREQLLPVLEAMDGLPVTVRLLDAPLHEFLPDVQELLVQEATGGLDLEQLALLAAARSWHEHNPMLGVRGVRLAALRPALYRAQVRAVVDAAVRHRDAGGDPHVAVMVPLVVDPSELVLARSWVQAEVEAAGPDAPPVPVGTMIETPRAALLAGPLAAQSDFVSFGTNDLTQLVFGFSRDDVASRVVKPYVEQHLLPADPFTTVDRAAVLPMVARAVAAARAVRPGLEVGVCGEHAGDPGSVEAFVVAGVDYVSCSTPRLPVARLAAARAVLDGLRS